MGFLIGLKEGRWQAIFGIWVAVRTLVCLLLKEPLLVI